MKQPVMILGGTYTLEPFVEVVDYWSDHLDLSLRCEVGAYAQLFQLLLDPSSALRSNQAGANVICLRWEDLVPQRQLAVAEDWSMVEPRLTEVASTLAAFQHVVPCLVLLGPSQPGHVVSMQAHALLARLLDGVHNLSLVDGADAMSLYEVTQPLDPVADRFGHVPFTPDAIAALGTIIARWYAARTRAPVKVIAVDGDYTLWRGAVAESGLQGVQIDAGHAALQAELVAQAEAGRLLCLLSKNEEEDVRALFAERPDMLLKWTHLVSHRVDWKPKPANLRQLVDGLALGLDSVVFLDDNPVECAQMRSECPAVTTVRVPGDSTRLGAFRRHLWLFDQPPLTSEDRGRSGHYRAAAQRAEQRRDAPSLEAFLAGLELVVEIDAPAGSDLQRLVQLAQRTNQFNASLMRSIDNGAGTGTPAEYHRVVRARDRFGDYGVVGQIRGSKRGNRLELDLLMLSCRALGRGIEHRMLSDAGQAAIAQGLGEIGVLFVRGERNAPARRFLEAVTGTTVEGPTCWFRMSAQHASSLVLDASSAEAWVVPDDAPHAVTDEARAGPGMGVDLGARYEHIAVAMTTGAEIREAVARRRTRRPALAEGFIAPAAGLEQDIATMWCGILRVDGIGAHDRFQDLGGKSIHLVQVHVLLRERLKVEVDIVDLFQHPTVASLAAYLAAGRAPRMQLDAARQRGVSMREARSRRGRQEART